MYKKTRNIALMAGALAAIGFGGSALSSAGAAPVLITLIGPDRTADLGQGQERVPVRA